MIVAMVIVAVCVISVTTTWAVTISACRNAQKKRSEIIARYITLSRGIYKNGNSRDLELMVPVNLWNQHRELMDRLCEELSLQPQKPGIKISEQVTWKDQRGSDGL